MTANQLRRIHDVTDNFFFWQGLRWVPLGAAMLGYAVLRSLPVRRDAVLPEWIALLAFGAAIWLSGSVLGRYYARHFGRVRGDPSRHLVRTSVKWLVVYPAIVVAMIVDIKWTPPVVVSGLAFAIAIEAFRQSTGGGRGHYVVASIGLIAFSILPLFALIPVGKAGLTPLIGIIGLIYIVGGLLDHRELVRVLAPVGENGRVASV